MALYAEEIFIQLVLLDLDLRSHDQDHELNSSRPIQQKQDRGPICQITCRYKDMGLSSCGCRVLCIKFDAA